MKVCKRLSGSSFGGLRPPYNTRESMLIRAMGWIEESRILMDTALKNYSHTCATLTHPKLPDFEAYARYVADHIEITPKLVVPSPELSVNEKLFDYFGKDKQAKCLFAAGELLSTHCQLLEYVVDVDLKRIDSRMRSTIRHPHDCSLLDEDGSGHFVCQIRATLERLRKTIRMMRSIAGDTRPDDKSMCTRNTRYHGDGGQRYTIGVLYKTRELLANVNEALLLLRVRAAQSENKNFPNALSSYALQTVESDHAVGEIILPSDKHPKQSMQGIKYRQISKKIQRKYPIESFDYAGIPALFETLVATPSIKRTNKHLGIEWADEVFQPESTVVDDNGDDLYSPKCEQYVNKPANVLYLGCNRNSDVRRVRCFPPLHSEFVTPAPNHYSPQLSPKGPFYTIGRLLPDIVIAKIPDSYAVKSKSTKSRFKDTKPERTKPSAKELARKEKILVSEWYDYQRKHLYFPYKFDHFATNRIIKERVIRYPPNVDYAELAHTFSERAMPTAPCYLPLLVKTLVLP